MIELTVDAIRLAFQADEMLKVPPKSELRQATLRQAFVVWSCKYVLRMPTGCYQAQSGSPMRIFKPST
jgi:hypothetical protein